MAVNKSIELVIPGRAIAATRATRYSIHRQTKEAERIKRYVAYKEYVFWRAHALKAKPLEGPLEAKIDFYFADKRCGDIDNLLKAVFDGMQKVLFRDDSQIIKVQAEKHLVKERKHERTEIEIKQLPC